jgi:hypothetical protein
MSFEKHLFKLVTSSYSGFEIGPEPLITSNPILFTSDGSGGLILNHLYIKSSSGLIDLSAAGAGSITGGINVGGEDEIFKSVVGSLLQFRTLKAGTNISITQNTDDLEIAAAIITTYETILTSFTTVIDSTKDVTEIIIDTAGVSLSSLAVGTVIGQKKTIVISNISLAGSVEISLALSNGTKLTFDGVGQGVQLIWTSLSTWTNINGGAIIS